MNNAVAASVVVLSLALALLAADAPATKPAALPPLDHALRAAEPGQLIDLPHPPPPDIPLVPVDIKPAGDVQLLFSDHPEYIKADGLAMRETVEPGVVRLYVYHVPEPRKQKTITAVIENLSDEPLRFEMLRGRFWKPSGNYHAIGKRGLVDFWSAPQPPTAPRELPPRSAAAIDPAMDAAVATTDELVHGLYEFRIDRPARVSVLQREPDQDSAHIATQSQLTALEQAKAGAGCGKFVPGDRDVSSRDRHVLDTSDGPRKLVVADGKTDPWAEGTDALRGQVRVLNRGNYGIVYRVRLRYRSPDGRGLAIVMSNPFPATTKWCEALAAAVKTSEGVVPLPKDVTSFGHEQLALIQKLPPAPIGETREVEFTYSPPGASCLPTPILFVPYQP